MLTNFTRVTDLFFFFLYKFRFTCLSTLLLDNYEFVVILTMIIGCKQTYYIHIFIRITVESKFNATEVEINLSNTFINIIYQKNLTIS